MLRHALLVCWCLTGLPLGQHTQARQRNSGHLDTLPVPSDQRYAHTAAHSSGDTDDQETVTAASQLSNKDVLERGSCIDGPEPSKHKPSKPLSQGPYKRDVLGVLCWADKQLFLGPESGVGHSLLTSI